MRGVYRIREWGEGGRRKSVQNERGVYRRGREREKKKREKTVAMTCVLKDEEL